MYKIIGADGKEYGPVPADVLRQWVAEGRANAQTKVLAEGATQWKPLGELPGFIPSPQPAAMPVLAPGPISAPVVRRNNSLAVAGLVMGLFSVTCGLCCCYGMPFNLAGVICSSIALSQIHQEPERQGGKAMAMTGLVLSLLSVVVGAVFMILGITLQHSDVLRKVYKL